MCRSIKPLFNFDPPTTEDEIRAAALQFVRKISACNKPSKVNEPPFLKAIEEIADASSRLLHSLQTNTAPKSREEATVRKRLREQRSFGI